jgi:hypothetical protein
MLRNNKHPIALFAIIAIAAAWTSKAHATDQSLQELCTIQLPTYVENMCAGSGTVADKSVLALPNRCLEKGFGDRIEEKLQSCKSGNIYSDVWKFRFSIDNTLKQSFVDYVNTVNTGAGNGTSAPIDSINVHEMYNITYLACGSNANCHAEFFDLIPDNIRRYLITTPLYCDYHDATDVKFEDIYVDYLVDKNSPHGFREPVCRQFYCQFGDCDGKETVSPVGHPFILGDIWQDYYRATYERDLAQ